MIKLWRARKRASKKNIETVEFSIQQFENIVGYVDFGTCLFDKYSFILLKLFLEKKRFTFDDAVTEK